MEDLHLAACSRRHFLVKSALAAGTAAGMGAFLQSGQARHVRAAQASDVITLTVMLNAGELNAAEIALFEQQNPGIKINRINADPVQLAAMLTAGQPPDVIRTTGAPEIVNFAARGLALDLTPYFQRSKLLNPSNLMPVNDVYRWDGKEQGKGPFYGMATDWSQDGMMWYNKKLFDQAGVKYLSETEPIGYDELFAIAKKLTVRQGGRTLVYGLDVEWGFDEVGQWMQMLAQDGKSLWNSDYTEVDFTSPEILRILKWYIDAAQAHVGFSPLDPDAAGWSGPPFQANRLAIAMYGYWFESVFSSPPDSQRMFNSGEYGFAPAPLWGHTRVSACHFGTGAWIPTDTKHPDAAFKVVEYVMSGKPAIDHTTGGVGIPSLKSLLPRVPQSTPAEKRVWRIQQNELRYLTILRYSPYVSYQATENAIAQYLTPVMKGQVKLQDGARQLQDAVNKLARIGKQQIG